ncbi:MAG: PH domain-containing protein [Dehalococcoidia bacterium]|jgi:hypothetical protein
MLIHEEVPRYDSWLRPFISGFIAFTLILGLVFLMFNTELAITMFAITVIDGLLFSIIIPRNFEIHHDKLRIRLGGPFAMNIPLSKIDKARPGSSGDVWVYWGIRFGTSSSNVVEIVRNKGMNIIITPEDAEEFIDQLNRVVHMHAAPNPAG